MGKGLTDLQVLVPYEELVKLVTTSHRVDEMQSKVSSLEAQQTALWGQLTEVMEAFGELKKYVID